MHVDCCSTTLLSNLIPCRTRTVPELINGASIGQEALLYKSLPTNSFPSDGNDDAYISSDAPFTITGISSTNKSAGRAFHINEFAFEACCILDPMIVELAIACPVVLQTEAPERHNMYRSAPKPKQQLRPSIMLSLKESYANIIDGTLPSTPC